jgi:predicted polyphosphate/ATP-dependent NAD kinase
MRIGLIVNPIAGMGGSVGLKGTDGNAYMRAVELGAVRMSHTAAMRAVYLMRGDIEFVSAEGLGSDALSDIGRKHDLVPLPAARASGHATGSGDTKAAAKAMAEICDLILFCGGDGTARDISDAVGTNVPVLGIPAGVKMYSSVFATTPEDIHTVVHAMASGEAKLTEREVMDINEEDYKNGILSAKLYGYLKVPFVPLLIQTSKGIYEGRDEIEEIDEVAEYVITTMRSDTLYLIGAGSTTGQIMKRLGLEHTVLGIDAVFDGKVVGKDLNEKKITALLGTYGKRMLILGIIGKQGFFLGRGNKELTPAVVRNIGAENIVLVASVTKLNDLKELHVDTGDPELDRELKGYKKVVFRYARERALKVV